MARAFAALIGFIVGIGGLSVVYMATVGTYRATPSSFPGAHPGLRGLIALCVFLLSMTLLGVMTSWLLHALATGADLPRKLLGRDWALGLLVGLASLALLARRRRPN
jgi:hypothetical protein